MAIERNRAALAAIVAGLVVMAGALAVLPRKTHSAILAILRPAESAVRRLIFVVAHGVTAKLPAPRAAGKARPRAGKRSAPGNFQLFDSRKRFSFARKAYLKDRDLPGVSIIWDRFGNPEINPRLLEQAKPSETIAAARLAGRLSAITAALADLPAQAQRLANWSARRAAMAAPKFRDPFRPGHYPPGYRKARKREIDEVLWECVHLVREREKLDTS